MVFAGNVVVPGVVLQGEGDVNLAVQNLDVERCVAVREARVGESTGRQRRDLAELRVEDIHAPGAEVRRINERRAVCVGGNDGSVAGGDSHALVDGAGLLVGIRVGEVVARVVDGDDRVGACLGGIESRGIDAWIPPGDRPVLGCEQEDGFRGRLNIVVVHARHREGARAGDVEHRAGGSAATGRVKRRGNADDQSHVRDRHVEGGNTRVVVRDPEGTAAALRDSPGVDQVGVQDGSNAWQIRHQVGLQDRPEPDFRGRHAAGADGDRGQCAGHNHRERAVARSN